MRKIGLLLLTTFMALCLFTACGSEEEPDSIVGKWQLRSSEAAYIETSSTEAEALIKEYVKDEVGENYDYDIKEFTADGKLYIEKIYAGTYSVSGGKLTINYEEGFKEEIQFEVFRDKLSLFVDVTKDIENDRKYIGIADDVIIEKVIQIDIYQKIQ